MKKFLKHITSAAVVMLALAVVLPLNTMAVEYTSDTVTETVKGQEYEMWSSLYKDSSTKYRGASWAHTTDSTNVPVGYIGVGTGLYSTGGTKYAVLEVTYNTTEATFHYRSTSGVNPSDGNVYCKGTVELYNGTKYETFDAPETIVLTVNGSRAAVDMVEYDAMLNSLAEATLDAQGNYPVTAAGETYGSELLEDLVGERPDLILAEGVNGMEGYVRADDIYIDVNTPAEAMEYMEELKQYTDGYREVPLYDLDGNEIDKFRIFTGENEVTEEIQATIDALTQIDARAQEKLNAKNAWLNSVLKRNPSVLDGMVNGDFPRNSSGETYGNEIMATVLGYEPELQAAIGTNGESGYIRKSDIIGSEFIVNTPEDAMRYMEYMATQPDSYLIPLYDKEGNVIGQFLYGGSEELGQSEIDRALSAK